MIKIETSITLPRRPTDDAAQAAYLARDHRSTALGYDLWQYALARKFDLQIPEESAADIDYVAARRHTSDIMRIGATAEPIFNALPALFPRNDLKRFQL